MEVKANINIFHLCTMICAMLPYCHITVHKKYGLTVYSRSWFVYLSTSIHFQSSCNEQLKSAFTPASDLPYLHLFQTCPICKNKKKASKTNSTKLSNYWMVLILTWFKTCIVCKFALNLNTIHFRAMILSIYFNQKHKVPLCTLF